MGARIPSPPSFASPSSIPTRWGNPDLAQVARKLEGASYAEELRAVLGSSAQTVEAVVTVAGTAVEAFLLSPAMAPFSSRYDAYVRGEARLSDTSRCAAWPSSRTARRATRLRCHKLDDGVKDPARSLFTDYGFEVVGVPRNRLALPEARRRRRTSGLCKRVGAARTADEPRFCGAFRTPSLRNVAARTSFMHNGAFLSLRDVVAFYSTRIRSRSAGTRMKNSTTCPSLPAVRQHRLRPLQHGERGPRALTTRTSTPWWLSSVRSPTPSFKWQPGRTPNASGQRLAERR